MRVREGLKTEIKFFFSKYLFCILISLISEGEQFPLTACYRLPSHRHAFSEVYIFFWRCLVSIFSHYYCLFMISQLSIKVSDILIYD